MLSCQSKGTLSLTPDLQQEFNPSGSRSFAASLRSLCFVKKGAKSQENLCAELHTAKLGSSARGTSARHQQELLVGVSRLGHFFPLQCLCCQLRFLKAYTNIKF